MNIGKIRKHKTDLEMKEIEQIAAHPTMTGVHESVLRAYHIVDYVKRFLVANPLIKDTVILLELIAFMEAEDE